jgi:sugar phosphate isomerase/epimerase
MSAPVIERLVCSPCCLPTTAASDLLPAYRELGFTKYEAFCTWAECRHEWTRDPHKDRDHLASFGLRVTSYHLPMIGEDIEAGLNDALAAARYASVLGGEGTCVLFKAATREIFGQVGKRFLNALEKERLGVVPVVQNHRGTAITTLDDYQEVLTRVNDSRLKGILEVGHFQRVGTPWKPAWDVLGDTIALIHLNDINKEGASVLFGTGEVDIPGLMQAVRDRNFDGNVVVELELASNRTETEQTLNGLRDAIALLERHYNS